VVRRELRRLEPTRNSCGAPSGPAVDTRQSVAGSQPVRSAQQPVRSAQQPVRSAQQPVHSGMPTDKDAWGWRDHTTRDSGPQARTVQEWVQDEGKHRSKPTRAYLSSSTHRFKADRDRDPIGHGYESVDADDLYASRVPLNPRSCAEGRLVGGDLPRADRFADPQSAEAPGAVLQHYEFEHDRAVWYQTAKTVSPTGRGEPPKPINPCHAYSSADGPDSIAERAGTSPSGLRVSAVFDNGMERLHAADACTQEAIVARRVSTDPRNPGPGRYQIVEPCDWQRHDLVIKGSIEARIEDRVRPSSVFLSPKARSRQKTHVEPPGPGSYDYIRAVTAPAGGIPITSPFRGPRRDSAFGVHSQSPPTHYKLQDDTRHWTSGRETATSTAWSGAVRGRFASPAAAGSGLGAAVLHRSEAVGCNQLRDFIKSRERSQRKQGEGLVREEMTGLDQESAQLLRALRRQSKRNHRSPEAVRRQRERDELRSSAHLAKADPVVTPPDSPVRQQ
jgi:hypothetical protein